MTFEAVEQALDLSVVEFLPRIHVSPEQNAREFQAVIAGQAELLGERVRLTSALDDGICRLHGTILPPSVSNVRERVVGERSSAITDDIADLGVLVSAAHGLDVSWMTEARCAKWDGEPEDQAPYPLGLPTPWQFDFEQEVVAKIGGRKVTLLGKEMCRLALAVCFACPVQWSCANYGVKARVRAGTYAMRISDMRWLQYQEDALELIEVAETLDVPLQRFVPAMRQERASESAA